MTVFFCSENGFFSSSPNGLVEFSSVCSSNGFSDLFIFSGIDGSPKGFRSSSAFLVGPKGLVSSTGVSGAPNGLESAVAASANGLLTFAGCISTFGSSNGFVSAGVSSISFDWFAIETN